MCLGPTHEEVITEVVRAYVQSYRQLPVTLYQIQTKFRDELRTRFGIVRACEFIMKDAYSFDRDQAGLEKNYKLMYRCLSEIFKRCGLNVVVMEADSGAMGGGVSHEFLVPAPIGEDAVIVCPDCGFAAEFGKRSGGKSAVPALSAKGFWKKPLPSNWGISFSWGQNTALAQEALFLDEDGKQKPMIMGCYGIGVSRLIAAIVETNYDAQGIIWPHEVAPFDVEILPLQTGDVAVMDVGPRF